MGAGIFWGIILVIIGLGIIIRVVFNIHFPIFKFLVAFFFIFIGLRILLGSFGLFRWEAKETDILFKEERVRPEDKKEYNVIFSSGEFDLRDIDLGLGNYQVKVNTIFGGTIIKVNEGTPLRIDVDAVFASAKLPKGNSAVIGSSLYTNEAYVEGDNYLFIKADVVFGSVEVKTY